MNTDILECKFKNLTNSTLLNNLQMFLSDSDYDVSITIKDSVRIHRIIAGYDVY